MIMRRRLSSSSPSSLLLARCSSYSSSSFRRSITNSSNDNKNSTTRRRRLDQIINDDCNLSHLVEEQQFMLHMGGSVIPLADKGPNSLGEDALYFRKAGHAMAVADGVGSWSARFVDAGLFAREFMGSVQDYFEKSPESLHDPLASLFYGHKIRSQAGSAAICALSLDTDKIKGATIGDCRFLILRYDVPSTIRNSLDAVVGDGILSKDRLQKPIYPCPKNSTCMIRQNLSKTDAIWNIVYKSAELQHGLNFPFQLGDDSADTPDLAATVTFPIHVGDIIIMGTDGVFDNLFLNDIRMIVSDLPQLDKRFPCLENGASIMQNLAQRISEEAEKSSRHPSKASPYSRQAQRYSLTYVGGKTDDIGVICGIVACNPNYNPLKKNSIR